MKKTKQAHLDEVVETEFSKDLDNQAKVITSLKLDKNIPEHEEIINEIMDEINASSEAHIEATK